MNMNKNSLLLNFGVHLRKLRLEKNLTQWNLVCKGDFDRNYIGMLERGERNPTLFNLVRIAKALDVSMGELLDFDIDK